MTNMSYVRLDGDMKTKGVCVCVCVFVRACSCACACECVCVYIFIYIFARCSPIIDSYQPKSR